MTVKSWLALNEIDCSLWIWEITNFLEGLASNWFNLWINKSEAKDCPDFKFKITLCFGGSWLDLVIARMWDNFANTGLVDKYIKEYKKIQSMVPVDTWVNKGMVKHIFLKNLKYSVSKFFYFKILIKSIFWFK